MMAETVVSILASAINTTAGGDGARRRLVEFFFIATRPSRLENLSATARMLWTVCLPRARRRLDTDSSIQARGSRLCADVSGRLSRCSARHVLI